MRLHDNFEWDEHKAARNLKKHSVSFEDAAYTLSDEEGDAFHVEEFDDFHSKNEDRYLTTAAHPDDRDIVLRIVWTDVSTSLGKITRVISARVATPSEREQYVQEINRQ